MVGAAAAAIRRRDTAGPPLAKDAIDAFNPFIHASAAAYCPPSQILNWTCGPDCDALSGFVPIAAAGDGDAVQFWYVGFLSDQDSGSILVVHQGTDPTKLKAVLTDIILSFIPLKMSLFPNLPSGIKVHDGFAYEHEKTAAEVLAAVQKTSAQFNTKKIILSGHSLGAALTMLDLVFLQQNLNDPAFSYRLVNFGQPRVGNAAFADFVDATFSDVTHVHNKHDPVPILPGRFLGFVHPNGEIHIGEDDSWTPCPGQDSTAAGCTIAEVPNIVESNVLDHLLDYNSFEIGGCISNILG